MSRRRFPAPVQLGPTPDPEWIAQTLRPDPPASVAVAEVLGFSIRWLRELPLPSALVCHFADGGGCVVLATAHCAPVPPGDPPAPTLVGPEVDALALGVEHDRVHEALLRGWLTRKPDWGLTAREAIGSLGCATPPLGWTTGRVLRALGLRLDEVWV